MILFSLPFHTKVSTVLEGSGEEKISFIDFNGNFKQEFKGQFIPFNEEESDRKLKTELLSLPSLVHPESISKLDYRQKVNKIVQFLKEKHLKKLVFSRRKIMDYNTCDLRLSFENLKSSYPNAFSYLFIKDEECWMGAFSELLGKYSKKDRTFETMSLAGTLPLAEMWTQKEIAEQKTVTDFIAAQLEVYCENVTQSAKAYDLISGNIKHLRTDFKADLQPDNLDILIQALHPTPAVCGIPKDVCKAAIKDYEDSDRELYAGYIKIDTAESIYFFVNLRCARFYAKNAVLFLGGGITAESDAEKEWQETELKAEAITRSIAIS